MSSQPVRILEVYGNMNIGGAESMIMNLYRHIDCNEVQLDFVVHTEAECAFDAEIRSLGGRIFSCPKYRVINHFAYRRWWSRFFSAHPEYRVIHGHMYSTASVYLREAKRHGLFTVAHSHSSSSDPGIAERVKDLMQHGIRFIADRFFGCSDAAGIWLFGDKVVASDRYMTLNNAIDVDKFDYSPSVRAEMRSELGLGDGPVFAHIGRYNPVKNHTFLVDVIAEARKRDPSVILLSAGDGPLLEATREKAAALGLPESAIRFLGLRRDADKLLQAADVFVFPSLYEGLPVTLVEAQTAGLPCVVSDVITRETDLTGLVRFIPLSDGAAAWADTALELVKAPRISHRKQISDAGYDIERTSEYLQRFYIDAYNTVLSASGKERKE